MVVIGYKNVSNKGQKFTMGISRIYLFSSISHAYQCNDFFEAYL